MKYSFFINKIPLLPKKAQHLVLGEKGEKIAQKLCRKLSLEIIFINFNKPGMGEIDIIARDGATLCFIEVKTRQNETFDRPARAVTVDKKIKLHKTARYYINQLPNSEVAYRFDIIEVVMENSKNKLECRYWPNAWTQENLTKSKSF